MACVFCSINLDGAFVATNYGKACNKYCAAGGVVCKAVECAMKAAPCIGHSKLLCAGVHDLTTGTTTPNVQFLLTMVQFHHSGCALAGCTLPHTLERVLERTQAFGPPPPISLPTPFHPEKRRITADDAARVVRAFRAKYDLPNFTENLKSIMRSEGIPDMQQMLDPGYETTTGDIFFLSRHACTAGDVLNIVRIYRFVHVPLGYVREFTFNMKSVMCQEGFPELQRFLDKYIV
jgi:hypothetical protein